MQICSIVMQDSSDNSRNSLLLHLRVLQVAQEVSLGVMEGVQEVSRSRMNHL